MNKITVEIKYQEQLVAIVTVWPTSPIEGTRGATGEFKPIPMLKEYIYEYYTPGGDDPLVRGCVEAHTEAGVTALLKEVFENLETKGVS